MKVGAGAVYLLFSIVFSWTIAHSHGQAVKSLGLKFQHLSMAEVIQADPMVVSDFLADVWGRLSRVFDVGTDVVVLKTLRPSSIEPKQATELLFSLKDAATAIDVQDATSANYDKFATTLRQTLLGQPTKDITNTLTFGDSNPKEVNLDKNFYQADVAVNIDDVLVAAGWPPAAPEMSDAEKRLDALKKRTRALQIRLTNLNVNTYKTDYNALLQTVESLQKVISNVLYIDPANVYFLGVFEGSVVFRFTAYPALEDELAMHEQKWTEALTSASSAISGTFPDADFSYPAVADLKTDPTPTEPPFDWDDSTTTTAAPEDSSSSNTGVVAGAVVGSIAGIAALAGVAAAGAKYRSRLAAQEANAQGMDERSPGADGISPGGLAAVDIHGERTPNIHNPM